MSPEAAAATLATDPAAAELMAYLAAATGNARLAAKGSPVMEAVRARLAETGAPSLRAYVDGIKGAARGSSELEALVGRLTVGETFFFRQGEHFAALRDQVVPACLARNAARRELRIWSAGCANGAEPYSIAILLARMLGDDFGGWNVTIMATDINRASLRSATMAVYSGWALRGLSRSEVEACFRSTPDGWQLRERYRRSVRFVHHNLVRDPVPSPVHQLHAFDIVFCRNVMLYFDDAANEIAAAALWRALAEDGVLFVAPTDVNAQLARHLSPGVAAGVAVYCKHDRPSFVEETRAIPQAPAADRRRAKPGIAPPRDGVADLAVAVALADRGDVAGGERAVAAVLAATPFRAEAHYYRGLVLLAAGRRDEATVALKRAIYLDREFALAHYQLAELAAAAGDAEAARKGFRNATEILALRDADTPAGPETEVTAGALRALAQSRLDGLGR